MEFELEYESLIKQKPEDLANLVLSLIKRYDDLEERMENRRYASECLVRDVADSIEQIKSELDDAIWSLNHCKQCMDTDMEAFSERCGS